MKFVALALVLLCINIGMSIVNYTGILSDVEKSPNLEMYADVTPSSWSADTYNPAQVSSNVNWDISNFWQTMKALGYMLQVILTGIVAIPFMFGQFGIPADLSVLFSLPFYAIYLLGLAEFIGNRSVQ